VKIKYILLSVISGILLAFSFPNFIEQDIFVHTFFIIWIAFIPLFLILYEEVSYKEIFVYGFITGAVFYLLSLYWLCNIKPMGIFAYVAWLTLSLYLSLFFGASMFLSFIFKKNCNIDFLLSIPISFTILEYLREWLFTGFPLQTPAQSQLYFYPFIKILKITGVAGANFLIYFVNILITDIIFKKKINFNLTKTNFIFFVFILSVIFISFIISNIKSKDNYKKIKIAILQPDINQDVSEWTGDFRENTLKTFKELVLRLKDEKPDIIVWPETGYPGVLNYEKWRAKEISEWLKGAWHIIGSDKIEILKDNERNYYNTAFIIDEKGNIKGEYSKYHLVPFGEYVPLQNVFSFVKKVVKRYGYVSFTPGEKIEPINYKNIKLGTLICYDSLFPEISREFVKKGASLLVHMSYETWYGRTPATSQIFQNTALRAVENDVSLVRCVASGISGFVDNNGKIYNKTKIFTRQTEIKNVDYKENNLISFYTKYGDWFVYLILFFLITLIIINKREKDVNINN